MPQPTDFEQLLLEYINRARMDPTGEFDALIVDAAAGTGLTRDITNAISYFGVDLDSFAAQLTSLSPLSPLAWNDDLADAAAAHNLAMAAADTQSHQVAGEAGLLSRVQSAGYVNVRSVGENVYAYTKDPEHGHSGFFIDWGYDDEDFINGTVLKSDWQTLGDGIQDPPGHRNSILSSTYTEVGIAVLAETDSSTSVGPYLVTQDFGRRFTAPSYLVGVVLDDQDGDRFYDMGEGLGGMTITVLGAGGASYSTTSWDSGGYQIELASGTYTVVVTGAGFTGEVRGTITMSGANVKFDAFAADAGSSPLDTVTGTEGNDTLDGDSFANRLNGLGGDDWLTPGAGSDTIDGGAGTDMVSYSGAAQRISADLSAGTVTSGGDTDTLIAIEQITGSIYGDYIVGDAGNNRIRGLGDYDWLVGSDGADSYDGGTGRDMVSYVNASAGVTVNLGTGRGLAGQANGDRYTSIERITGSVFEDLFYGSSGEDDFRGLGGYDWFVGSGGGKDRYDGGTGYDTVAYTASGAAVTASLLLGRGSGGDAARDLYTSIENLTGSNHNDHLTGDHGRNMLRGMYGEDTLIGNGGVDRLYGGKSNDTLDGGSGWDYALYDGNRSEYTVSTNSATGITTVTHSGADGTDSLTGIEALLFADDIVYL